MSDPLILTAAFDPVSADLFQDLRDRYFPPALNLVPAHLTLFHHLPGHAYAAILATLRQNPEAPLPFAVTGLRFLGRGVALDIACPALAERRRRLADDWGAWLTPQDRQGFKPHVTVQNKVSPAEARATRDALAGRFSATAGLIVGLDLWWYRGGPWEVAGTVRWPG